MIEIYTELIQKALEGDRDSLNELAEVVHGPIRTYVFRITLNDDLTDDIVQETIIEMFNIFKQLKKADRFWPWLCKIALNKIRNQSRTRTRRKELLTKHAQQLAGRSANREGLANALNAEIKQAIFKSMAGLTEQQKAVLSMRCYENMPYSQIAEIMDTSELSCRLMFYRAKKKLQSSLFKHGFGKEALLAGLIIFGKFTAPSQAAAANISISAGTLSAGAIAATIGLVTSKTVVVVVATGALALGTATVTNNLAHTKADPGQSVTQTIPQHGIQSSKQTWISEGIYFYPQGPGGAVLSRLSIADENGRKSSQILQNDSGNYYFNPNSQSAIVENHHYWNPDLSVMMLPTDPPSLKQFVADLQQNPVCFQVRYQPQRNLMITALREENHSEFTCMVQSYDALAEERFNYNWFTDSGLKDHRDDLHKNGWCVFRVHGQVSSREVTGTGQMPFTFAASQNHPFKLLVYADNQKIVSDTSGTFAFGINQPWRGLHVLDTVRRNAAGMQVPFETAMQDDKAVVLCRLSECSVEYTIDLDKDWIDRIVLMNSNQENIGQLVFEYFLPDSENGFEFHLPNTTQNTASLIGRHWIFELAENTL